MFKLIELLKKKLTVEEMEGLPQSLNCTTTRKTQIIKDPTRMTLDEINRLLKLMPDVSIEELIIQYKCGQRNITVADLDNLGLTIKSH